jgi:hypothetical protein
MYGPGSPYNTILTNILPYLKQAGGNEDLARKLASDDIDLNQRNKQLGPRLGPDGKPLPDGGGRGDDNPLAATTQIVNNVNLEIKSIGSALNTLLGDINKNITTQRDKDNKFIINEVVNATSGQTNTPNRNRVKDKQEEISKMFDNAMNNKPAGSNDTLPPWLQNLKDAVLKGIGNPATPTPVTPVTPAPTTVAPVNSSSITPPGMNVLASMPNVNTKVSSANEAPNTNNIVQVAEVNNTQDKVVEKLGEISTIMARVEQNTKNTARYSQDTAANIKDVGPYA